MPIRTALSLLRAAFIAALTATVLPMTAHAAAGDPLGPDFRVDSGTGTGVLSPAMARDSIGNGVVVWERLGSSAPGIHARRYGADGRTQENGRESCRERVCQSGLISVGAVALK